MTGDAIVEPRRTHVSHSRSCGEPVAARTVFEIHKERRRTCSRSAEQVCILRRAACEPVAGRRDVHAPHATGPRSVLRQSLTDPPDGEFRPSDTSPEAGIETAQLPSRSGRLQSARPSVARDRLRLPTSIQGSAAAAIAASSSARGPGASLSVGGKKPVQPIATST